MKEYTFTSQLWLASPRPQVFSFFADALNLEVLTPPWLQFEVLTPSPIKIQPGSRIDYRIRVHGFTIRWRSQITEWNPPNSFVDVQLRGPYTLWNHRHSFHERDGGTLCVDEVRYRPRGGALINWLFVRRDVERIFKFRANKLNRIFRQAHSSDLDSRIAK